MFIVTPRLSGSSPGMNGSPRIELRSSYVLRLQRSGGCERWGSCRSREWRATFTTTQTTWRVFSPRATAAPPELCRQADFRLCSCYPGRTIVGGVTILVEPGRDPQWVADQGCGRSDFIPSAARALSAHRDPLPTARPRRSKTRRTVGLSSARTPTPSSDEPGAAWTSAAQREILAMVLRR
jgi:hypothetical protein